MIAAHAKRDRTQPEPHRRARLELVQTAMQHDEHVLYRVLDVARRYAQAAHQAHDEIALFAVGTHETHRQLGPATPPSSLGRSRPASHRRALRTRQCETSGKGSVGSESTIAPRARLERQVSGSELEIHDRFHPRKSQSRRKPSRSSRGQRQNPNPRTGPNVRRMTGPARSTRPTNPAWKPSDRVYMPSSSAPLAALPNSLRLYGP